MRVGPIGMGGSPAMNGMNMMIMQSQEYTDKLIELFTNAINSGYNPNVIYEDVFSQVGCTEYDLTATDRLRLKKKVEAAMQSHHSHY